MAYLQNFTNEKGRMILMEILKTISQTENNKKINEARALGGKDMIGLMQFLFPLVMQLQMDVIKKHGFPGNRDGLIQFSQLIREMENEDTEIAKLRTQIRSIYLPPIVINTSNDILV